MIKKCLKLLGAAAVMSAALSFAASAAAITSVNFTYTIDGDSSISEGYNEPSIVLSGSNNLYYVSDCECTTTDSDLITGKTALTYKLTLESRGGNYFAPTSSVSVSGSNISEVIKSATDSSDNTVFTVRFKAYPYYQLAAPSFVTSFDDIKGSKSTSETTGRGTTLSINKNGASKIEYLISYVDQNGEAQHKAGTTTGSTISVSAFNKLYTGSSSSKQSCYIKGIAIRAAGVLGNNSNAAPSKWVFISGGITKMDTEDYFTSYENWEDFLSGSSSSSSASGSTASASGSPVNIFGWSGSGNTWYYYNNGVKVTGWVYDGSNWYYCDLSTGAMRSGWIQDGSHWYYLNEQHDGSYGCMKTGWIKWNGKYYYLNPVSNGTKGAMITGTATISGRVYNFDSSGALIG